MAILILSLNLANKKASWLGGVPAFLYALFVGALSDDLGRKPLLMVPQFGNLLAGISDIFMYVFMEQLPLEFFYLEQLYSLLGGAPVYSLGFYGYGSSITTFTERASRLARYDGTEAFALLCGTSLAPVLANTLGSLWTLILRSVLVMCTLGYMMFVPEPIKRKESGDATKSLFDKVKDLVIRGIMIPIYQMLKTIFQRRPGNLRLLILVKLFVYGLYTFMFNFYNVMYLYMLNILEIFDGNDYAYFLVYRNLLFMTGLFVVMPILSGKLKLHEGLILTIVTALTATGIFLSGFATKLWHFYVTEAFSIMRYCQYSAAMALFTKCVGPNEVGKIYSAVSMFSAVMPILSNPAFRGLYDLTLDTFPAAFIFLGAAVMALCSILNFFIFSQRKNMLVDRKGRAMGQVTDQADSACDVQFSEETTSHM